MASSLVLIGSHGIAQENAGKPALPSGPLLKIAPRFSQWQVVYAYPQDKPASGATTRVASLDPNLPRKIVTTITEKIIHEDILTVGGAKIERYQIGQTTYTKLPNVGFWAMYNADDEKNYPTQDKDRSPVPANGFRGLDWVDEESYAGTIKQEKGDYLVFIPGGNSGIDLKSLASLQSLSKFACIDEATRMPTIVGENSVIRTYSFLPAPTAVQVLPADLNKDIKEGEAIKAKLNTAPGKEY